MRNKSELASRLREVRVELFGWDGISELARLLQVPPRTWVNYENGVTIPGEVLLAFVDATRADPVWLMTGAGPMFRTGGADDRVAVRSDAG
jgi:hypothetical protein